MGIGCVIIYPMGDIKEKAIRWGFPVSNNEVEYEAVIFTVREAFRMRAKKLQLFMIQDWSQTNSVDLLK